MEILSSHVQKGILEVIAQNRISDFKIKLSPLSGKGENYLGTLYKIEITGIKNQEETKSNLICKVPPTSSNDTEIKQVHCPYEREIFIYNTVIKQFEQFQSSKDIPKDKKFKSFASCYNTSEELGKEFLILEDLTAKSFVLFDKNKQLDDNHLSMVLKGLARFHAFSFAIRDQQPETFHKITQFDPTMYDSWGKQSFIDISEIGLEQTLEVLEERNLLELYKKIQKVHGICEEVLDNGLYGVGSENYRVISHGDCWNNNFLFKYQNGVPQEICFIDWQLVRFVSPVLDLLYFFYLSCEDEIFFDNFDNYMDLYYQELKNYVQILGSDLDKLYSHEAFQNDFKRFGKFGIIHCSYALNFTFANSNNAPELEDFSNTMNSKESLRKSLRLKDDLIKKRYAKRMLLVVQHAAKKNFI